MKQASIRLTVSGKDEFYGTTSEDFTRLAPKRKVWWCGWREAFLFLLVIGVVACVIWWFSRDSSGAIQPLIPVLKEQPHILFILADDVGWNDVGYHGSDIPTPFIDSLANDGIILDNYYTLPFSASSRAALLTGRLPIHTKMQHGVIENERPHGLPTQYDSLALRLRSNFGYSTHLVGKWHLGFFEEDYTPNSRGFESFYGFYSGHEDYFYHNGSGYSYPTDITGYDFRRDGEVLRDLKFEYSTHLFASRAIQLIENHDPKDPIFILLSFQAAQSPVQAPDFYIEKFCSDVEDENRQLTCAAMAAMDEGISNITDALKSRAMWANTMVFFASDNGAVVDTDAQGGSNSPLRGGSSTLFEGGVKVPAFVHSPLIEAEPSQSSELMHVCDWFTTLLNLVEESKTSPHVELLQSTIPPDSFDMWPVIVAGGSSPRTEVLLNIDDDSYDEFPFGNVSSIRRGEWKLITGDQLFDGWYGTPGVENVTFPADDNSTIEEFIWLFNLVEDPQEQENLAEENLDKVSELLEAIDVYRDTMLEAWFPERDNASHPDLHDGVWSSWR